LAHGDARAAQTAEGLESRSRRAGYGRRHASHAEKAECQQRHRWICELRHAHVCPEQGDEGPALIADAGVRVQVRGEVCPKDADARARDVHEEERSQTCRAATGVRYRDVEVMLFHGRRDCVCVLRIGVVAGPRMHASEPACVRRHGRLILKQPCPRRRRAGPVGIFRGDRAWASAAPARSTHYVFLHTMYFFTPCISSHQPGTEPHAQRPPRQQGTEPHAQRPPRGTAYKQCAGAGHPSLMECAGARPPSHRRRGRSRNAPCGPPGAQ
jgi:hypothetical protein